MDHLCFRIASNADIPFIQDIYEQNIAALHGAHRSCLDWEKLLSVEKTAYYVVCAREPAAWFRTEIEEGALWLGMLVVAPRFQGKGIGHEVLSYFEALAANNGIAQVGIHTTEDNFVARSLYENCGYTLTEIGPCTTADGVARVGYTYMKMI